MKILLASVIAAQCVSPAASFVAQAIKPPSVATTTTTTTFMATTAAEATTDDLLKPSYDIEPIPMRIGHGFDIHRMAPLEEAGQPVVIGGVEIPHKDQKVGYVMLFFLFDSMENNQHKPMISIPTTRRKSFIHSFIQSINQSCSIIQIYKNNY